MILITIDSLRADHLGCYGYERDTSPDIDRIANQSTLFLNAVTQAPWTSASLASLLSSTYPTVNGVTKNDKKVSSRLPLLAESLKKRGFYTAAFVNQPFLIKNNEAQGHGLHRGFSHYESLYAKQFLQQYRYKGDQKLTEDVLSWLKKWSKISYHKKLFLWVHYMNPHGPYTHPPRYDTLFREDGLYVTNKKAPTSEENYHFGLIHRWQAEHLSYSTDVDRYVAQYDGGILFINDQISRLYNRLKELDLVRKSIIVITADHGESMWENNWYFEHGMPFETNTRVPLIIKVPDISPRRIDTVVSLIDVAPTISNILGIQPPSSFMGKSLLPLIEVKTERIRSYAYGETGHMDQQYIRSDRYKLIVQRPKLSRSKVHFYKDYFAGKEEIVGLFDIRSDPYEEHNLAEEKPELAASMYSQLQDLKETNEKISETLGEEEAATFDDQTKEILKALGYLD